MFTDEEQLIDQLTRIAEDLEGRGAGRVESGMMAQLTRIADALERIAAALDAQKWETKNSREPYNLHSLLLLISQKL